MDVDIISDVSPQDILDRLNGFCRFASSILHLDFPTLEKANPSFGTIARYLSLLESILKDSDADTVFHEGRISELAEYMRDIADAIVDRNNDVIVDSMASLDDFQSRNSKS